LLSAIDSCDSVKTFLSSERGSGSWCVTLHGKARKGHGGKPDGDRLDEPADDK